jgi:ribonuclease E
LALEGREAKALPAPELPLALEGSEPLFAINGREPLIALDGQEPQAALESSDAQKKSRRRKRGKGNGEAAKTESAGQVKVVEAAPAKTARAVGRRKRKMFVNVLAGEQVEVVISEEGQIHEYYIEMLHQAKIKGNIYKGVIHNVDPNLQAAFVSYGAAKNGFLQIDEVHPEYYLTAHEQGKGHKYPLIQKALKAGQEILVQVVKEPSGTKGAFLTSYLSIPGRYLVLTPGREQIGVSRKVGNDAERGRLREMLNSLNPGDGLGVIVRTVSEGASKTNLQRDLQMLKRVWRDVRKKGSTEEAPTLIYQELGLAARAVRDYLTEDVAELWVNDKGMGGEISEVITMLFPKRKDILQLHDDSSQSLFERFGLARQISQIQSREVVLPSGGRLVFDQTEALMAIDINSGRTGGKSNFEDMAFKINLEAAQHIPLQLRLRDIGGQIVADFIEMRDRGHWREVEKTFRNGMKEDRARHDVSKIRSFGLLEVVRQRLGSSAISIASEPCPFCKGTGVRRNMEWQALQAMQEIQQLIRQNSESGKTITYMASGELVLYLLNSKKEWLLDIEQENNIKLELRPGI